MGKNDRIRKTRTKGTSEAIIAKTNKMDFSVLITDIFVWTDNQVVKKLLTMYESQLVLACVNPTEFVNGLHSFYTNTSEFITKNNLEKDFLSFVYFIYSSLKKKNIQNIDSLNLYLDILMQQFNYFVYHPTLIYGLTSDNQWMVRNEPYPNIDMAIIEAMNTANIMNLNSTNIFNTFKRYGYEVKNINDIIKIQANDQLLTNMLLITSYFINENTPNIVPKEFYQVACGIRLPMQVTSTDYYKSLLREKSYFLPSKGVKGIYKDSCTITEIYFQEVIAENRIILLYKVTCNDKKDFCGFYDTKLELFSSPWTDTDGTRFDNNLENFILESYCYLTTDIDNMENTDGFNKRLHVVNDNITTRTPFPSVQFLFDKEVKVNTSKQSVTYHLYDKKKYKSYLISLGGRPRKLPTGAKPSEEALQLARDFNFIIREGETFVKPFKKKVYRKKEE